MIGVRLMLLMVAANLALVINVAKAGLNKGDSCWVQEYEDLQEKYHNNAEYVKLIDYLVEHFKSPNCNKFQAIRNDLELVQRTHQMDLRLCKEMTLDMLISVRKRYGINLRNHLESQMQTLVTACRGREFNHLIAKLNQKSGKNERLGDIFELARYVDPSGAHQFSILSEDFLLGRYIYEMSPGIIEYLIKRSKDDEMLLQEHLSKASLGSKRERFDKLYKRYVVDTCINWINATYQLNKWANYGKIRYAYVTSNVEDRCLNYRHMCESIYIDIKGSEALKELVYREIQQRFY